MSSILPSESAQEAFQLDDVRGGDNNEELYLVLSSDRSIYHLVIIL